MGGRYVNHGCKSLTAMVLIFAKLEIWRKIWSFLTVSGGHGFKELLLQRHRKPPGGGDEPDRRFLCANDCCERRNPSQVRTPKESHWMGRENICG